MTPRDRERLKGLHPALVDKITRVFDEMEAAGCIVFVVEGVRSDVRQRDLYALGRTKPGQVVTYKDGVKFKSRHQPQNDGWGYAVDVAFVPDTQRTDPFSREWPWEELGLKAEAHGLLWGGRWKMADLPHLELVETRQRFA